jgi:hypothetical protein
MTGSEKQIGRFKGISDSEMATRKQPLATRGRLIPCREERNMDRTLLDAQSENMDAEEKYQNVFFYFIKALRILAMDAEPRWRSGRKIQRCARTQVTRFFLGDTYVIATSPGAALRASRSAAICNNARSSGWRSISNPAIWLEQVTKWPMKRCR